MGRHRSKIKMRAQTKKEKPNPQIQKNESLFNETPSQNGQTIKNKIGGKNKMCIAHADQYKNEKTDSEKGYS